MTDKEIMRKLRRGDEAALEALIDRYSAYAAAIIRNIIGATMSNADVEEAAADVFVAIWRRAAAIRPETLKSYIAAAARNSALKKLRRAEGTMTLPIEEDLLSVPCPDPQTEAEERQLRHAVNTAILNMEQPDRDIFLRHYYYNQPVTRIANEMGMSQSAVKMRLKRGREKLSHALEKEV